ncbi:MULTISPECIES: PTS system mannose/fructose/N-acetylgalactosamine-transporter subunit IIB [unclassified Enterococcus]|uniref:PTS system mannose/fructose/N-acetylgalactosamine-transporter subunit IIB n=1 Tax=unclassified Enterococcus TaxID=2608891 RepID=UPI001CE18EB9|nr:MULTISPECIES: PTS sugar transporter subunit IIB [unclassified Enterococcus]MCA5014508.1 PTS sugar transporter subunit IIB [Enterococcus sp. S23]MCA5017378.1 PTS sugar transporter subunit IIB [Enterococcus sp. S22(2020)]
MTIVHARVDERLIHGQVATVWTNTVGAQRIMVVNDLAVKDQLQIGALKMAKPAGVKLSILSKRKAIEKILAGNYEDEKVFLITKDIADMAALIDGGVPLNTFNIGNISQKEGSKAIKKSVALTEEEIQTIHRLISQGVTITAQMIPSEPNESVVTFIK